MACCVCKKNSDKFLVKCDGCSKETCQECVTLTASEIKVLQLKNKRSLVYYCGDCTSTDAPRLWNKMLQAHEALIQTQKELIASHKVALEEKDKELQNLREKFSTLDKGNYAAVLSGRKQMSSEMKEKIPTLVIKPKDSNQTCFETKKQVAEIIQNCEYGIGVRRTRNCPEGAIKIKCRTKNELDIMVTSMESTAAMAGKYTTEVEKLNKPRLKVVQIEKDYSPEELKSLILKQNNLQCDPDGLKVVYMQKIIAKNTFTAYLEVSASLYTEIMVERDMRIFVGWQRCRVYNDLNLRRCWKCGGYGHTGKNCKNEQHCQLCAGAHDTKSCENKEVEKCVNCIKANEQYNADRPIDHCALDERKCETYLDRKKFLISKTDFPYGKFVE